MQFTFRDLIVFISMATTVVLITFTFSALGLSDETVSENNMPEFNISANNFDMVGDFPEDPGTPSKLTLTWDEELEGDSTHDSLLNESSDSNARSLITTLNTGNETNLQADTYFDVYNDTTQLYQEETTFTEVGDYHVFEGHEFVIYAELTEKSNYDNPNETSSYDVSIDIRERPDDSSLEQIPVIGGAFTAAQSLGNVLSWAGLIIYWFSAMVVEIVINMIIMLYSTMLFFVQFMQWLITSYTAVISGASNWASVFVALPAILLMAEFSKLILIGIKLLPTT